MQERSDCRALETARRHMAGWLAAVAGSSVAGAAAPWFLGLEGAPAFAASAGALAAGSLSAAFVAWMHYRRLGRVAELCSHCAGPSVYHVRRASYTCPGPRGLILCYTYALDRFYAVRVIEGVEEVFPPWRPADFYCVRFLGGGRVEDSGGVKVYRGRLAVLPPRRGVLVIGEGVAAFGDAGAGMEAVVDAALKG